MAIADTLSARVELNILTDSRGGPVTYLVWSDHTKRSASFISNSTYHVVCPKRNREKVVDEFEDALQLAIEWATDPIERVQ